MEIGAQNGKRFQGPNDVKYLEMQFILIARVLIRDSGLHEFVVPSPLLGHMHRIRVGVRFILTDSQDRGQRDPIDNAHNSP